MFRQTVSEIPNQSGLIRSESPYQPPFLISSLSRIFRLYAALNIAFLFRFRNCLIGLNQFSSSLVLLLVEVVVALNVILINLLLQFVVQEGYESALPNSSYSSRNILKARIIHEAFWSPKNITIFRSNENDESIPLFAPKVVQEVIGSSFMAYNPKTNQLEASSDHQTGVVSNNRITFPSRLNDVQSPILLKDKADLNHFTEISQNILEGNDSIPLSRSKSYFSRSFFNPVRKAATSDNESISGSIHNDNNIEIISISKDNKTYH